MQRLGDWRSPPTEPAASRLGSPALPSTPEADATHRWPDGETHVSNLVAAKSNMLFHGNLEADSVRTRVIRFVFVDPGQDVPGATVHIISRNCITRCPRRGRPTLKRTTWTPEWSATRYGD